MSLVCRRILQVYNLIVKINKKYSFFWKNKFFQNLSAVNFTRKLAVTNRQLNLLFTDDHEWVKVENGVALIGISQHAADALGDIVYVELPEAGDEIEKGGSKSYDTILKTIKDDIGVIESVKSVGNIISPVSGEIIEINEELADDASTINRAPYDEGLSSLCIYNSKSKRMAGESHNDRRIRCRGTDGRGKIRRILRRRRELEFQKQSVFQSLPNRFS